DLTEAVLRLPVIERRVRRNVEERAGTLARAAVEQELRREQLGDEGARAIPRAAHAPGEVLLVDDRQVERELVRLVVERAGVLPLLREAEGIRRVDEQNL